MWETLSFLPTEDGSPSLVGPLLSLVSIIVLILARALTRLGNWRGLLLASVALLAFVDLFGAGIGATTARLCGGSQRRWVCLEPDPALAATLQRRVTQALPRCCEAKLGTLSDLDREDVFDSILFMDVLEHIEDDRSEVRRAQPIYEKVEP